MTFDSPADVRSWSARRVPLAARFWLVLGVLVLAMGCMAGFALIGVGSISAKTAEIERAVIDSKADDEAAEDAAGFQSAVALYVAGGDAGTREQAHSRVESFIARLRVELESARERYARRADELRLVAEWQRAFERAASAWQAGAFSPGGSTPVAVTEALVAHLFPPVIRAGDRLAVSAAADEAAAAAAAASSRDRTRTGLIVVFLVTSGLGIGLVVWLIRSVVSRARRYSTFAVHVSAGGVGERLDASGWDELADLGRSLDALVSQHEHERAYRHSQGKFIDAMQVTESEEEAHQLIKRHLERSIAASTVVVLNRNNSHDRLESRTPLEPGSSLELALEGAVPRSCLAVRFGQRHERGVGFDPLLRCTVCGETAESTVCDPLLVSGEVIGSVLLGHSTPLTARDDMRIRDSVTQAAPVLANLRNLAIAELRAATDALTGLPNKRAVRDTMKRMVAQATRAETPLAVAFLDLDHFKQINDTFGHERGDEALAAVAEVMRETLRESDFVGRYGGEEFLLLLPDTDATAAHATAAAVRTAITRLSLPGLDRPITASVGIAILPTDSIDTETLVRSADRALYAAKSNGRDRIEFAGASTTIQRAPKNRAA